MNIELTINAWRDEEYRDNLDGASRELLPTSPIGEIDLSDTDLDQVAGGEAGTDTELVCFSISVLTILCLSIIYGGTCENDTTGCCKAEA